MTQTRGEKNHELMARQYKQTGVFLSFEDVQTLRMAERTLHNWSEQQCGWSNQFNAGLLIRDEETNVPYHEIHGNRERGSHRVKVNDLETGALRRVAEVCKRNGLEYFRQSDPRGCSLYISKAGAGMNDSNYPRFVAVG